MSRKNHQTLTSQISNQLPNLNQLIRIKPRSRLIQYQHLRIMYNRRRNPHTLTITLRQLLNHLMTLTHQPRTLYHLLHNTLDIHLMRRQRFRLSPCLRGTSLQGGGGQRLCIVHCALCIIIYLSHKTQILTHIHIQIQRIMLRQIPHQSLSLNIIHSHSPSINPHFTLISSNIPRNNLHQC